MKEHCHPCDMIFIILWGEGDSANGNYPDAEREREIYSYISREECWWAGPLFLRSVPTINRVTSSIQKKTSNINMNIPEVHTPQQASQGCIIANISL